MSTAKKHQITERKQPVASQKHVSTEDVSRNRALDDHIAGRCKNVKSAIRGRWSFASCEHAEGMLLIDWQKDHPTEKMIEYPLERNV